MGKSALYSTDPAERDRARRISRYNSIDFRVSHSQTMFIDENNDTLIRGDDAELRDLQEVKTTINWLFTITRPKSLRTDALPAINLNNYRIKVFAVYTGAQPHGFDFMCNDVDRLLKDMELFSKDPSIPDPAKPFIKPAEPIFNIDTKSTLLGRFAGLVTPGTGFRQISMGASLHVELSRSGRCNIHVDKAGIVCGYKNYNLLNFINHGITDLIPGYTNSPWLYGTSGNLSWKPDLQLKLTTDPFAFGPDYGFHDQTMMNERHLGVSFMLGYKIEWK